MMKRLNIRITARRLIASTVFATMALSANMSVAQEAISALKNHDTSQPIDISADRMEVRQNENIALLIGKVKAIQGNMTFTAERVTVYYEVAEGATKPTIARLDATGQFKLVSPTEVAEGSWGVYDVKQRLVTMGGAVKLTRNENIITADRLVLDLETGVTNFDGRQDNGRVQGRFAVPEKNPNR